ncbi:Mobile element protein, partial [Pseudomonas amygdali pv. myricae]
MAEFSEEHKPRVAQLLVTAATCKSSSHTTTSWAACTANGYPIW